MKDQTGIMIPTQEEFIEALDKAQEYARSSGMKQEDIDKAIREVRENKHGGNDIEKE